MRIPLYQIDAFTGRLFQGNPAAVCVLERWLDPPLMQSIAMENNLSETAFVVAGTGAYGIRWFTPTTEVDLCGHATLASAHVIFNHLNASASTLTFESASGRLQVTRDADLLWLDFPARPARPWSDAAIADALGARPREILRTHLPDPEMDNLIGVFDNPDAVRALAPDMNALMGLEGQGVVATAPGEADCDFVSRYFVPKVGVPEDPVTGSTHTTLAPFWAGRLNRDTLSARQLSPRGGELALRIEADRVLIGGRAVQYLEGSIVL